jgi:hypothetical protein
MARTTSPGREMFTCTEPFVVFRDGIPDVFGPGRQVFADNPILKSHPANFVPSADRVEQMTAGPGELRAVAIPDKSEPETKETEDG